MQQPMITRRRFNRIAIGSLAALPALLPPALHAIGIGSALDPFAGIVSVEVFCNGAMLISPVTGPPFAQRIYRMDALEQMSRSIDQRLPQGPDHGGEAAARRWIMAHEAQIRRSLAPAAAAAANAINLAHYYRIDHLPAIVINRRGLVYGVTDVMDAIARYQAHRQQEGLQP